MRSNDVLQKNLDLSGKISVPVTHRNLGEPHHTSTGPTYRRNGSLRLHHMYILLLASSRPCESLPPCLVHGMACRRASVERHLKPYSARVRAPHKHENPPQCFLSSSSISALISLTSSSL